MTPKQKFEIGEKVRDTYRDKHGTISAISWFEGDCLNPAEWFYSIDHLGYFFYS